MTKATVCLLSPTHVASNPRLVKEADALHEAGYDVKVIAIDISPKVRELDKTILGQVQWAYRQVRIDNRFEYALLRLRQKWAQSVIRRGFPLSLRLAGEAHSIFCEKLISTALSESADLYIAHYIAALPAAAQAARKHKAKFGFDAEDFHIGELGDTPDNSTEIMVRDFIERTLLPDCIHRTASSPMIAEIYAERYGVTMTPILNVFPLKEAPSFSEPSWQRQPNTPFTLYWFSQTIGPGRGLDAILQVMAKVRFPVNLVLRGSTTTVTGFVDILYKLATDLGISRQIEILPSSPPTEMARLAACYDLGLSIEPGRDKNNQICLGNKIFTYLLAGLPVLLSRTPAQEQLSIDLGEAALLVDLENTNETAQKIECFFSTPGILEAARRKAWRLGQERYNWDLEKYSYLELVERALQ